MADEKDIDNKDDKDKKVDKNDDKNTDNKGDDGKDKSHDTNLQKALDAERKETKKLKQQIKDSEDTEAKEKSDADQKKKEAEGKYEEILEKKDKEISELKPKSDRLDKLLEAASEANKKTIESITDEKQKEFAQEAIKDKDSLEAQSVLGKFQNLIGDKKPEKKGGEGVQNDKDNQDGAEDVEITKLKEELEAIFKKKREGTSLSQTELKSVITIPRKIKEIRDKNDKTD